MNHNSKGIQWKWIELRCRLYLYFWCEDFDEYSFDKWINDSFMEH